MKVTPHQRKYLEYLSDHGIEFVATHWSLGTFPMTAEQIEPFTEDPDQFAADHYQVTKKVLVAWGEFRDTQQCHGITRKGSRCKSLAPEGWRIDHPREYNTSDTRLYCGKHTDQSLRNDL